METRASHILVGSFVLAIAVGLLFFTLWMAQVGSRVAYDEYDIYFTGSVSGIRPGSSVTYRGIGVGEVALVRIDPSNVERVQIRIRIDTATPVKEDTWATLRVTGLTGAAVVSLEGGTQEAPNLVAAKDQPLPVIEARASGLEKLIDGAPQLVERADQLVQRALELFAQENVEALAATVHNLEALTGAFASNDGKELQQVMSDLSAAMSNLNKASASVVTLAESVERDFGGLSKDARSAMQSLAVATKSAETLMVKADTTLETFDSVGEEARAMIAENRRPLADFSSGTLYDLSSFVAELRQLVASLNRVTTDVGRNPRGFLFGGQQQGYEAQ